MGEEIIFDINKIGDRIILSHGKVMINLDEILRQQRQTLIEEFDIYINQGVDSE